MKSVFCIVFYFRFDAVYFNSNTNENNYIHTSVAAINQVNWLKRLAMLAMAVSMLLFWSCKEDTFLPDENTGEPITSNAMARALNGNDKPDTHDRIVLGRKLINPYSVANMQNAFDYYNGVVANSPFHGMNVTATHYYIQINPQSEENLEVLDNLDNESKPDTPLQSAYPTQSNDINTLFTGYGY